MLVLSRKIREQILIADDVVITVLGVRGNRVRLGFECAPGVKVLRAEIAHERSSIDSEAIPAQELTLACSSEQ